MLPAIRCVPPGAIVNVRGSKPCESACCCRVGRPVPAVDRERSDVIFTTLRVRTRNGRRAGCDVAVGDIDPPAVRVHVNGSGALRGERQRGIAKRRRAKQLLQVACGVVIRDELIAALGQHVQPRACRMQVDVTGPFAAPRTRLCDAAAGLRCRTRTRAAARVAPGYFRWHRSRAPVRIPSGSTDRFESDGRGIRASESHPAQPADRAGHLPEAVPQQSFLLRCVR